MDGSQFDRWTVAVTRPGTRRSVVRMLAAVTAGGALTQGSDDALAACKNDGRKCKKDKNCCSKLCKGKRCRCKHVQESCPVGLAAQCCGSLICGDAPCVEGSGCCRPTGLEGCTENCDCCTELSMCQNGRCCRPLGAPCGTNDHCCSLHCENYGCIPAP